MFTYLYELQVFFMEMILNMSRTMSDKSVSELFQTLHALHQDQQTF